MIMSLGETIRQLKHDAIQAGKLWQKETQILDDVWKLQNIKMKYEHLREDCGEFPKHIKIRWKIVDKDGNKVRLQHQYPRCIELTGAQVVNDIDAYTAKKYPELGGFTKIELVLKERDEDGIVLSTSYQSIHAESKIRMPLIFPGPILKKQHIFQFRIHFPGRPYHFTTPLSYKDTIPQLIDMGANLFYPDFDPFIDILLRRSYGAGVTNIALISVDLETTKKKFRIS